MTSRLALLLAAFALALFAGCGDDDDDTTTAGATGATGATGTAGATGDVARYCELTQQLDEAGEAAFEGLEDDPDATREDFEQAEREFVEEHEAELDEIVAVAPEEIRDEVDVLLAGLRGRAGLEDNPPPQSEQQAAEERVDQFEQEEC